MPNKELKPQSRIEHNLYAAKFYLRAAAEYPLVTVDRELALSELSRILKFAKKLKKRLRKGKKDTNYKPLEVIDTRRTLHEEKIL